jgi:hypothetical protein
MAIEYIGIMFTSITVPDVCRHHALCYRRALFNERSTKDPAFILSTEDLKYLNPRV